MSDKSKLRELREVVMEEPFCGVESSMSSEEWIVAVDALIAAARAEGAEAVLAALVSDVVVNYVAHRVDDVAPQPTHLGDQRVSRSILAAAAYAIRALPTEAK